MSELIPEFLSAAAIVIATAGAKGAAESMGKDLWAAVRQTVTRIRAASSGEENDASGMEIGLLTQDGELTPKTLGALEVVAGQDPAFVQSTVAVAEELKAQGLVAAQFYIGEGVQAQKIVQIGTVDGDVSF